MSCPDMKNNEVLNTSQPTHSPLIHQDLRHSIQNPEKQEIKVIIIIIITIFHSHIAHITLYHPYALPKSCLKIITLASRQFLSQCNRMI